MAVSGCNGEDGMGEAERPKRQMSGSYVYLTEDIKGVVEVDGSG